MFSLQAMTPKFRKKLKVTDLEKSVKRTISSEDVPNCGRSDTYIGHLATNRVCV